MDRFGSDIKYLDFHVINRRQFVKRAAICYGSLLLLPCALCHEIRPSCVFWKNSVHTDISCTQCHGHGYACNAIRPMVGAKQVRKMIKPQPAFTKG